MRRFLVLLTLLLSFTYLRAEPPRKRVDFETDIRPLLAQACTSCHGEKKQKADLRLDLKAEAMKGGESGPAIVPGMSGASLLVERITDHDPKRRMPPKDQPPLTETQIAMLRAWIDQGATWPDYPTSTGENKPHWAYQPLAASPVPALHDSPFARSHPIDAFIQAKLRVKNLRPSPAADRRTWLRRVSFNLTGLPPTPEEISAFLADDSPWALERVVDRLLASPHYGERWARHWIDVAHFAESHGHDQDRPRPNAWPYRDYLIRSFNEDKPYARFVAEQVAGDVLFPDDPQATVALGFLAAGPWDESSLRDIQAGTSDHLFAQVLDRDDMLTTVMTTFVSSTVNCARCHNHKFDPISIQDYYALQAVFAGVDRAERMYDPDPNILRRRRQLLAQKRALEHGVPDSLLRAAETQQQVVVWEERAKSDFAAWEAITPTAHSTAKGSTASLQSDGSLLYGGIAPEADTYWIHATVSQAGITGVRLEVLSDDSLPMKGPGRQDNGNLHLSEFRVLVWPGFGLPPIPWPINRAVADFNQTGWTIDHAIDGKSGTAWGIFPEVGQPHSAVFAFTRPLPNRGVRLTFMLAQQHGGRHLIGRPRLTMTTAPNPANARPLPSDIAAILGIPISERTETQRGELARFVLRTRVDDDLDSLPPPAMVYAAATDFKPEGAFKPQGKPKPVHVLRRGDIGSPQEPALPGALACLPGLPSRFELADSADEGARRAALANWLTHPDNVLTWRSIVNRVWHHHFGRGIVDTPSDFGKMGSPPSHPELLDWLARDFRDHGGSLKRLHRQIVLSATYLQSSRHEPEAAMIDVDNRLLWRMNRTRLDAESLRDAVLLASDRIDRRMGGPSVKQFIQTPGIHVTPNVDYQSFAIDDPANARRSVYRFLMRTVPDPFMDALDHPDGSQQAPVRAESVTAPQALAMLNNNFMVRQSQHLAARLTREAQTPEQQVRRLYERTLGREAKPHEIESLAAHARLYGLANVCRVILNCNEFVFVP